MEFQLKDKENLKELIDSMDGTTDCIEVDVSSDDSDDDFEFEYEISKVE